MDAWARWVLHDRFGGDENAMRAHMPYLESVRDRVIANAAIQEGDVVLDVGSGDGLIGFGALSPVGPSGRVIFSDVSQDLLDHCDRAIKALGAEDRCSTIRTPAETLEGISSASVDVVTTRSVLIYVDDKRAAFDSFHRVLRPDGRVSIFEPINRRMNQMNRNAFLGFDIAGVEELANKVSEVIKRTSPEAMVDFDETDLFQLALDTGFEDVRVTLELKSQELRGVMDWANVKNTSPNALAPTLAEAIAQALTSDEAERFEAHLAKNSNKKTQWANQSASAFLQAFR
jgi:ubiquinone/menaquinone biosynthesis C-methylase UbiE